MKRLDVAREKSRGGRRYYPKAQATEEQDEKDRVDCAINPDEEEDNEFGVLSERVEVRGEEAGI